MSKTLKLRIAVFATVLSAALAIGGVLGTGPVQAAPAPAPAWENCHVNASGNCPWPCEYGPECPCVAWPKCDMN